MTMFNQVTYRDMDSSEALNIIIGKRLRKLERFCSDIKSSRVVLESPHNHRHKGKDFRATLEIDLKGSPITISQHDSSIYIAVRDAFNVAERKLKSHVEQSHARRSQRRPIIEPVDTVDTIAS